MLVAVQHPWLYNVSDSTTLVALQRRRLALQHPVLYIRLAMSEALQRPWLCNVLGSTLPAALPHLLQHI